MPSYGLTALHNLKRFISLAIECPSTDALMELMALLERQVYYIDNYDNSPTALDAKKLYLNVIDFVRSVTGRV